MQAGQKAGKRRLSFDCPFLGVELKREFDNSPFKSVGCLDPVRCVKAALPDLPRRRLGDVYTHMFGEEFEGSHSAAGDVAALLRILADPRFREHVPKTFAPLSYEKRFYS